jgi:peptide chain release factor 1
VTTVYICLHATTPSARALRWVADSFRSYIQLGQERGYDAEMLDEEWNDFGDHTKMVLVASGAGSFDALRSAIFLPDGVSSNEATLDIYPGLSQDVGCEMPESDLSVEYYRKQTPASSPIYQTDCNVRLAHLPTGIVVRCQSDRARIRNYEKALHMLKSQLVHRKLIC